MVSLSRNTIPQSFTIVQVLQSQKQKASRFFDLSSCVSVFYSPKFIIID